MSDRLTVDTITSDQLDALYDERDEARQWARHGYEIGQRHCSWSDHGVAPAWLTEGWPPHIDSCEHLKHAAELEEVIGRVREAHDRITNAPAHVDAIWCLDQLDAALAEPKED